MDEEFDAFVSGLPAPPISHEQLYRELVELKDITRHQQLISDVHAEEAKAFRFEINRNFAMVRQGLESANAAIVRLLTRSE